MLNKEQRLAVDFWNRGYNIKVTAVPGAGKSRVLLECCKEYTSGLILILAYNHDLCEDTKCRLHEAGLQDRVICLTFHGLATYCIMPSYDDMGLFDAIEGVQNGSVSVQHKLQVSAVLVDEAQDFRPSFHTLMGLVLDIRDDVQYMVVGDENQMLYTYDNEDPADIKYLSTPSDHFASSRPWQHVEFYKSHRLTGPMAAVVSKTFNVNLESAKCESDDAKPVHLYSINLWKAGFVLQNILSQLKNDEVTILVPKKKNNGPLRAALNYISSKGVKLYLHGFDGQDGRIKQNKYVISTWHSSKGTENKTIIVLGLTGDAEKNPCFVALSRSYHHLIIIQDESNPYVPLMETLGLLDERIILYCQTTLKIKKCGSTPPKKFIFDMESAVAYSLDGYRPKGTARWIRDYQTVEKSSMAFCDDLEDVIQVSDLHEDVSFVYTLACCMAVEYEKSGKVRLLEDIRQPIRLTRDRQDDAIAQGHHSRFISPNIPINTLLGDDMLEILQIYTDGNVITPLQWCELASVARCWNDFHHTVRQLKPFHWFDVKKFTQGCTLLHKLLSGSTNVEFDTRVSSKTSLFPNTILHARVHAMSNSGVYYFVWTSEIGHTDRLHASIQATLHAQNSVATIMNLKTGVVEKIRIESPDEVVSRLLS